MSSKSKSSSRPFSPILPRGGKRSSSSATRRAATVPSRAERRMALHVRRARAGLVASVLVSVLIVVAWFPAGAIVDQRKALAAASSKLATVSKQDRSMVIESRRLSNPAEVARIARDQYQLVYSGQRLYEVLPPNGTARPGALYPGDPGLSPPVSPSAISELPPSLVPASSLSGGVNPQRSTSLRGVSASTAGARGTPRADGTPSFFSRVLNTLEFWR
ncbi:MAG: hypothetical protein M1134_00240 [Actinobacteria bacterium]|nr:hypothetical protein [Actinomycetota bacterium]